MRAAKQVLAALTFFASPAAIFAQGCPLCYQAAASSGSNFIHALRSGILVLLFPPMIISGGIIALAYRKRNQFNENLHRSSKPEQRGSHSIEIPL